MSQGSGPVARKRAAGFDEGHQLTLVVGGAAPDDLRAGRRLGEPRFEGRRLPEVERVRRLDVVVAVEENMRRAGPSSSGVGNDHRMTRSRPHRGFEAQPASSSFSHSAAFRQAPA